MQTGTAYWAQFYYRCEMSQWFSVNLFWNITHLGSIQELVVVFSWTWFYNSIPQTNINFGANIHVQAT